MVLLGFSASAANPSFGSFDQKDLSTAGNVINNRAATNAINANAVQNYAQFPSTLPFLLTNNWSAGTEEPMVINLVGDSLISTKRTAIQSVLQQYGFGIGQGFNALNAAASGGAKIYAGWQDGDEVTAFKYTLNGIWGTMTNTSGAIKYTQNGTGGALAKRITILYDANVIGTFAISNSVDGGSTWGFYGNVGTTGNSPTPSMTFTNITLPSCAPDIMVLKWLSGTNNISGVIFNPQQDKTIVVCDFSNGGQEWTDMTNMPLANVTNLAYAMRKSGNTGRLIIVQETSSAAVWTNAPSILNAMIQGSGTNTDVLLETCNPFTGSPAGQNDQIKSEAFTNNWVLWDDGTVFGTLQSGTNHGLLIPDNPHPTDPAGKYFSVAQMFDGVGLGGALRNAGASVDPQPLLTSDTHGNYTLWPTINPAAGVFTLLCSASGSSPGFFLNNATNQAGAPWGGFTADASHVYIKTTGGGAGLTIDSAGSGTINHHFTVSGDLVVATPDPANAVNVIGLEAASGASAFVSIVPIGDGLKMTSGTLYVTNIPTLTVTTNAAPSNVTIGVTTADYWLKAKASDGTAVFVPVWKAH